MPCVPFNLRYSFEAEQEVKKGMLKGIKAENIS